MNYRIALTMIFLTTIATLIMIGMPAWNVSPPEVKLPLYPTSLTYSFNVRETLQEADSMDHSTSPYWWLDSGGKLTMTSRFGETIRGRLPFLDSWRMEYAFTNPHDTDNGLHPQNIFRLVSKSKWNNVRQEIFFNIVGDNMSVSPNRNESNGVLLMSRYQNGTQNGKTLYYAGIRVDGTAVIKKKYDGTYYTMARQQIIPGQYSREENSNLLPHQKWVGLRMETITGKDKSVTIHLYMGDGKGNWLEILSARDDGKQFGGTPPIEGGHIGIRTDFMDVQFKDFHAEQI